MDDLQTYVSLSALVDLLNDAFPDHPVSKGYLDRARLRKKECERLKDHGGGGFNEERQFDLKEAIAWRELDIQRQLQEPKKRAARTKLDEPGEADLASPAQQLDGVVNSKPTEEPVANDLHEADKPPQEESSSQAAASQPSRLRSRIWIMAGLGATLVFGAGVAAGRLSPLGAVTTSQPVRSASGQANAPAQGEKQAEPPASSDTNSRTPLDKSTPDGAEQRKATPNEQQAAGAEQSQAAADSAAIATPPDQPARSAEAAPAVGRSGGALALAEPYDALADLSVILIGAGDYGFSALLRRASDCRTIRVRSGELIEGDLRVEQVDQENVHISAPDGRRVRLSIQRAFVGPDGAAGSCRYLPT